MNTSNKRSALSLTLTKGIGNSPIPWLIPLSLILLFVFLFPVFEIIRYSFTDASFLETDYSYTISSFVRLFTLPGFYQMLIVTLIFVTASVFFQMFFGFLIALLIDKGQKLNLKGTVMVRTAVLTAWAIPGVVIGIIWRIMYTETPSGILNYLISFVGVDIVPFLSDPYMALFAVTLANIWRGTAFSMILLYAGIQTLPKDVMEAAKIDGASAIQRLLKVMLPMLAPIILINLIIISIDTFNTFDMVMALTGGGPGQSTEVIALSIYNSIFREFNLGHGAATAVVLLTINVGMTIVYLRVLGKRGAA
ncbi:carbohydrate ABC transporter permease [Alkalicoccus daliensis]|uniref:Carbohydrate ABC transporter membrane protein 1, CUT1 family n=1 Tax=Alkalicoccus daliensis TaxID=745820 RepID=A0A1H0H9Q3_9BACI|nr:sugar ABC transporter permease [Alkalicoccus daliensis]SDO15919.1 carbohydrate ABC transporter membrane protein 1, CUT1 family [Alkalicoccus daliensis]